MNAEQSGAPQQNPGQHPGQSPDLWLDQALQAYVDAAPGPALRTRILAHAAAHPPRRRIWLPAALAAGAVAAAVLFFAPLHHATHDEISHVPHPDEASVGPSAFRASHPEQSEERELAKAGQQSAHRLPHREPSEGSDGQAIRVSLHRRHNLDEGFTEQDRLLVRFVTEHPQEARALLTHPEPQPLAAAPLTTAPLVVAPLQVADLATTRDPHSATAPQD